MFADDERCPCASGRTVGECSCKARSFVPKPARTAPPAPVTGLRVKGCCAMATGDGKAPMRAEHAVSNIALRQLVRGGKVVGASNRRWQKDQLRATFNRESRSSALAGSSVLC